MRSGCNALVVYLAASTLVDAATWSQEALKLKTVTAPEIRSVVRKVKPDRVSHIFAYASSRPLDFVPRLGWIGNFNLFRNAYESVGQLEGKVGLYIEVPGAFTVATLANGSPRFVGRRNLFVLPEGQGRILGISVQANAAIVHIPILPTSKDGCRLLDSVRRHLSDPDVELRASTVGWFPGFLSTEIHAFWMNGMAPPSSESWENRHFMWCRGKSDSCVCGTYVQKTEALVAEEGR